VFVCLYYDVDLGKSDRREHFGKCRTPDATNIQWLITFSGEYFNDGA
jgi:hypothetical protein